MKEPASLVRMCDRDYASCPGCRSVGGREFARLRDYVLIRCADCDLVYVFPRKTESKNREHYDDYYEGAGTAEHGLRQNRRRLFEENLKLIGDHCERDGHLIDVGAAYGHFLELAQAAGFDVMGVEVASAPCAFMAVRGIACHQGSLDTAPIARGSVDVVTMWDVLEHVSDPSALLEDAGKILRPGGLLAATVPNRRFQSLVIAMERVVRQDGNWRRQVPWHLNHFSARAIRSLLRQGSYRPLVVKPAYPTPLRHPLKNILKRFIYRFAIGCHALFGVNLGNELLVLAVKENRGPTGCTNFRNLLASQSAGNHDS